MAAKVATDEQILAHSHMNRRLAAEALGLSERRYMKRLANLREVGRLQDTPRSPPGMVATAVSTLHGPDGEIKQQWVKAQADRGAGAMLDAVKEVFAEAPRVPKLAAPKGHLRADLLTAYPMGDPHIGLYAWGAETGQAFDLQIAEANLVAATERLVATSPAAANAFIVNVGDFYHADTTENKTLRGGNVLDVDTRWLKVLRVGVRAMRACIEAALAKHQTVTIVNAIGNHDTHSSQMLTLALSMLYESNPRVVFLDSPGKFHYLQFGKVLFGVTHGDTVKPEALPLIMAADKPVEWGATQFRYWLTGHIHTRKVFEQGECLVESFRTLAARDAWTAASGYRSGRDMYAITYHAEQGEIERHRIDVAALQ